MPTLDYRTLILMISLFYLVLPVTVWLVLRMPRSAGPLLWCSGVLMGAVGFALLGLRGQIPDALSYLVGQPALVLGALLATQSMRLDLGHPLRWWPLTAMVLGYAAVLGVFLDSAQSPFFGALIRATNLLVVLALIRSAWQVGRAEHSRNAMTIAGAYAVQALGIALNMLSSLAGSDDLHTLEGSGINVGAYFLMFLVVLTACMAYLGLALERSTRTSLALTAEVARAEQWRVRHRAMVRADRERILNVLTNSLSHTMLQPLTAASLQLQMGLRQVSEGLRDPQGLTALLAQTVTEIQRANATVERMRALLRPQPAQRTTVDLASLFHDLEQLLHQRALGQRTQLVLPQLQARIQVQGDPIALTHALLQLIENALAAVSEQDGRRIELSVQTSGTHLSLRIADNGPGFALGFIEGFAGQRQSQVPSLQGVGLFVVQSIVSQHQGKLALENLPHGGAAVTLRLPMLC